MTKQTKLIDCGFTIFVYDFDSRRPLKEFNFEKSPLLRGATDIKRLLLTNFINDKLLSAFTLRIPFIEYADVQNRLQAFIEQLKKSSGCSNIQYLAVSELPSEENAFVYIRLITNLEVQSLTIALNVELAEEDEEGYFSNIWGDHVYIDVPTQTELLNIFDSAYHKSITSKMYNSFTQIIFKSRLRRPRSLWNEKANAFIENHNLLAYPNHRAGEIFDKAVGKLIINEYSLYDTTSSADEWDICDF